MSNEKKLSTPSPSIGELLSLIEKTYAVALKPEKIIEYLASIETFLESNKTDNKGQDSDSIREMYEHIKQASEVFDRMDGASDPTNLLDSMPYPAWVCDVTGGIPFINHDAIDYIGKPSSIGSLPIGTDKKQQLFDAVEDVCTNNTPYLINATLTDSSNDRLPLIITPWGNHLDNNDLVLVRIVVTSWPENLSNAIQASYRLTDAEIDVLEALVKGYSCHEIATLRNAKTETIRVQLKSIFRKTGTASQIEVVRLITGIISASNFNHQPKPPQTEALYTENIAESVREKIRINLPDDRVMTVYKCGDPNGTPFIYIHGYIDHALLPEKISQVLSQYKLLAICPARPGFGESSPRHENPREVEHKIQATVDDLKHMMDFLGLKKAVYVGSYTGGIYAYAMAAIYKQSVSEIIFISSLITPITAKELGTLPACYQTFFKAVHYYPEIIRYTIKLYSYLIKNNHFSVLWDAYFKSDKTDPDNALLQSNDFRRFYRDSIQFILAQGADALNDDYLVVSCPYEAIRINPDIPILSLRGQHDIYVTQDISERRRMLYPNVSIKSIDGAGTFVFYQKPCEVAAEIFHVVHKMRTRRLN